MAPKCLRCLFFTFNLLVWLFGIIIVAAGAVNRGQAGLFVISNLLIGIGCLVTLLGFMGCCGAIKRVRSMLSGYFLFVLVLFIVEISLGVCVYFYREKVVNTITAKVQHAITNRYAKGDKMSLFITVAIDLYQREMHCCGMRGPYDYHDSYWQNASSSRNFTVPTSCCIKRVKGCNTNIIMYEYSWMTNKTIIVKNHNIVAENQSFQENNHTLERKNLTHRMKNHTSMNKNHTIVIGNQTILKRNRFLRNHANMNNNHTILMGNHTILTRNRPLRNHTNMNKNHTTLMGNHTILTRNHTLRNRTTIASNNTLETEHLIVVMINHTIMTTNDTRIYKTGCLKKSKIWILKGKWGFVKAGVTIGVIETIGILCAVCLWCSFRNEKGAKK